jgi:prevent-host-death family protein
MEPLEVFTSQDLSERSEDLLRDAEQGRLALVTKNGRPVFVAVPFDEKLLAHGIDRAMAISLFEAGQVSLGQGARLAGLSLEEFIELLGKLAIPVVNYPPEDLEKELEVASRLAR